MPHVLRCAALCYVAVAAAEEALLVGWLIERAAAGEPAGNHLPLFFLQRGRCAEAVAAWHRCGTARPSMRDRLLAEWFGSAAASYSRYVVTAQGTAWHRWQPVTRLHLSNGVGIMWTTSCSCKKAQGHGAQPAPDQCEP